MSPSEARHVFRFREYKRGFVEQQPSRYVCVETHGRPATFQRQRGFPSRRPVSQKVRRGRWNTLQDPAGIGRVVEQTAAPPLPSPHLFQVWTQAWTVHPTIARSQSRLTAIVSIITTRHRKTTVIGLKKTKAQSLSSSL